jgi:protein-tyrosine phosphatase
MAAAESEWPRERLVPLTGGRNFRDLGGYAAADGRTTRWGVVFRAGSPVGLTEADWAQLCARGLKSVCDMRTIRERTREPFAWADAAGVSYWARDHRASFAELSERMREGYMTGELAREGMIAGYRELPFEQAPALQQLFAHLKAGEVPLMFNCAAGKDRTGIAAALLLTALGVPRATVVEDYLLTEQVLAAQMVKPSNPKGLLYQQVPEVIAAVGRADAAYVTAALETVEARHGSVEGFLAEVLEVSGADLVGVRDLLLA